jgi:tyrosine-protein kinase Etk/Wzc
MAQNPNFVGKEIYNSKLTEIDGQIKQLKAKLQKRTDDFLTNLLPSGESGSGQGDPASYLRQTKQKALTAQIELQAQMARKKALGEAIQEYNTKFEHLPKKTMDLARLQREKSSLEKLYLTIEEKYNEANITEQAELGYIDIYDPATVPDGPSSPKVGLNLLMGLVAGLGLGFLAVVLMERTMEKIRTPEDLKKHGFSPVLASIPRMDEELKRLPTDGAEEKLIQNVDRHVIMLWNPLSPIAEAFRHLRTNALYVERGDSPRRILVTSSEAGEGKTTLVTNLAIGLAQLGKRVLLVDADLRQAAVHTALGVKMAPGLSEVLARKTTLNHAVQTISVQNLSILTSGSLPSSASEFIGSDAMKGFVEQAEREYEMILFDGPPVLAVTDASILASITDRVIMVVSAGSTPVSSLQRATEMLQEIGRRELGFVLSGFDLREAYGYRTRRYGYGYGYGYAYPGKSAAKSNGHDKAGRTRNLTS